MRIGFGVDIHRFGSGDHLWLAGVRIPAPYGIEAHSDGDVVLHALCDALLGAAALGDIGEHFPDSDPHWKGAPSSLFVEHIVRLLHQRSLQIANVDITLLLQQPKIAPYKPAMRAHIAQLCQIPIDAVSLKATTSEGIGFVGRQEGIVAYCACLVTPM